MSTSGRRKPQSLVLAHTDELVHKHLTFKFLRRALPPLFSLAHMGSGFVNCPMGTRPQGVHGVVVPMDRYSFTQDFILPGLPLSLCMCRVLPKPWPSSRSLAQVFQMLRMCFFPSLSRPLCRGVLWWWMTFLSRID